MTFKEAFEAMKHGAKVKLPSWAGYWFWCIPAQSILMHTKDGKDIDVRSTECVDYTFTNICSDEWIFADNTNCPALGGEATFSFSEAIKQLKKGRKVARKGWNGKGMFLFVADEIHFFTKTELKKKNDEPYDMLPSITMKTADNKCVVGWVPSQTDMLAEDWVFAE